jgi:hypothetical protein
MVGIVRSMVVFLHIVIALASIIAATFTLFSPNKTRFFITYSLIGSTLASGMYLVWLSPAKMLHMCIAGLIYTVAVSAITVVARVRFAKIQEDRIP